MTDIEELSLVTGLSQGCTAAVFASFAGGLGQDYSNETTGCFDRKLVGRFVELSGWLPFNKQLEDIFQSSFSSADVLDRDAVNPSAQSATPDSDDIESAELQAINHIRDIIIDLPLLPAFATADSPGAVFLGHGSADERVSENLGQSLADFLQKELDMDVTWKVI
ncbi:hypothetical protein ACJ72_07825 [Emergomyces africanus]|uniref:Phospholipase/carboxylesterase/thioesterase domain-containing protein n=1 Tax=Emergomyces africanus TaxID=1955775 RepID=A0A1B7NM60_9EURO|nr:hypothetical protein ACJ72_07825 [Emergomyces africanus]